MLINANVSMLRRRITQTQRTAVSVDTGHWTKLNKDRNIYTCVVHCVNCVPPGVACRVSNIYRLFFFFFCSHEELKLGPFESNLHLCIVVSTTTSSAVAASDATIFTVSVVPHTQLTYSTQHFHKQLSHSCSQNSKSKYGNMCDWLLKKCISIM